MDSEGDNSSYGSYDDDGPEADYDMDIEQASTESVKVKEFKVLKLDGIFEVMNALLTEVSDKTSLPPSVCSVLLAEFQWNKTKLLEKFIQFDSAEKFLSAHKVLQIESGEKESVGTCNICFEDTHLIFLSCKHNYCPDCWNGYLKNKITSEKTSLIKCMGEKCGGLLPVGVINSLLNDPIVFNEYKQLAASNFVQFNESTKFCPGQNCESTILKTITSGLFGVKCDCGETFCMQCQHSEDHDPIDCERLEQWLSKCDEDNENLKWMKSHSTKRCPKCKAIIEKNMGCNHMTCRNPGCGHEFCWLCFGDWRGHQGCNRPDQNKIGTEGKEEDDVYLHYVGRFMAHKNSLKLEKTLYEEISEKIKHLKSSKASSSVNLQSFSEPVQILTDGRRILMYTYAFANFIKVNNQKVIFENNQENLEADIEKLSHALGPGFNFETVAEIITWKLETLDKLGFMVKRQAEILLDHVKEGNKLDQWEYK